MEAELGGLDLGASYMEYKGFASRGGNYSVEELDKLKYQKDFGDLQLEVLGQEVVDELGRPQPSIDQEELERMSNILTGIQPKYDTPVENINESLAKLERIARMTDLSSQAYDEYLKQIGE